MTEELINESPEEEVFPESSEVLAAEAEYDESEGEESVSDEHNYSAIIESDLAALRQEFPELRDITDVTELENPTRYGALRDLGLSPSEAYRASTTARRARQDTRSHLKSSAPRHASSPASAMSYRDLEIAREIFVGVSDAELQRLYKRVTK